MSSLAAASRTNCQMTVSLHDEGTNSTPEVLGAQGVTGTGPRVCTGHVYIQASPAAASASAVTDRALESLSSPAE